MTACVATYPPLAQATQIQDSEIAFSATLVVPSDLAAEPWQLALWYLGKDEKWAEAEFTPYDRTSIAISQNTDNLIHIPFKTASLKVSSFTSFTVKFRQSPGHDWRWVRDQQGLDDGVIIVNSNPVQEGDSEDLPDLIRGLNPDLKWRPRMSQCPNTRLWSIEAIVKGAQDEGESSPSTFADIKLGLPWGNFIR